MLHERVLNPGARNVCSPPTAKLGNRRLVPKIIVELFVQGQDGPLEMEFAGKELPIREKILVGKVACDQEDDVSKVVFHRAVALRIIEQSNVLLHCQWAIGTEAFLSSVATIRGVTKTLVGASAGSVAVFRSDAINCTKECFAQCEPIGMNGLPIPDPSAQSVQNEYDQYRKSPPPSSSCPHRRQEGAKQRGGHEPGLQNTAQNLVTH